MQLKRLTAAFVFLATAVLVSAQTGFKPTWATPKKAPVAAALQGVWTMTSIGGEAVSPKDPPLKIEFRPGKSKVGDYLITRGTDEVEAGEFRLTDTPAGLQVDFGPAMGDNAGKIQHGIMKIEDTKLTWCMSPAGSEERPTAFANVTADAARAATGQNIDGSTVIEAVKGERPKPAPTLLESIQGQWNRPDGFVYIFEGNSWKLAKADQVVARGQFSLDETAHPARVVWMLEWSKYSNATGTFQMIIDLNGNTLRKCSSPLETQTLPSAFTSDENNHNLLETLVRAESSAPVTTTVPSSTSSNQSAALQGTWTVTSVDGKPRGASERQRNVVFEGEEIRLEDGGVVMLLGTWQLNPRHEPATIDITVVGRDRQPTGELIQGLVEVNGNTLRFAMGDLNKPRPKSFTSSMDTDGVNCDQMILERR